MRGPGCIAAPVGGNIYISGIMQEQRRAADFFH